MPICDKHRQVPKTLEDNTLRVPGAWASCRIEEWKCGNVEWKCVNGPIQAAGAIPDPGAVSKAP